ncbi:MAG: hypothetical protein MUC48_08920 [Leptolyngbya sp. Prado105]|jgi:hypothetical protein|nr:hypothetical protein [Leptolyngbya sp. Prado105]
MTAKLHYNDLEQVRERLSKLSHYHKNRLQYRKDTEIAVEIVCQVEAEGQFPNARLVALPDHRCAALEKWTSNADGEIDDPWIERTKD